MQILKFNGENLFRGIKTIKIESQVEKQVRKKYQSLDHHSNSVDIVVLHFYGQQVQYKGKIQG